MDDQALSNYSKPAVVAAPSRVSIDDPLAAEQLFAKYKAQSMPTLHQYGIKIQQLIVLINLKIKHACLLMWHGTYQGKPTR